jgi:hypothetical protein
VKLWTQSVVIKVIGGTLTAKGAAMATEAQYQLFEALRAHTSELETERGGASGQDQAVLDRRIEAARKLLEWLSMTLESRDRAPAETRTPQ